MASVSSVSSSGSSTQLDQLINAFYGQEQYKLDSIDSKISDLKGKQTFYNSLYSKLNSLVATLDKYGDFEYGNNKTSFTKTSSIDDSFKSKAVSSSKSDVLTASASSDAVPSTVSMFVDRLASNDVLIAKQLKLEDEIEIQPSEYKLKLNVKGKSKEVTINTEGIKNNEELLKKIVNSINDIDEENNENVIVNASYIKDTSSTGRLTFTAAESGEENSITIDGDNELLKHLGLNNINQSGNSRDVASDTDAGFVKADKSELNSKMIINGMNLYRSSNEVDDVVPGITLNLLKPQEENDQPAVITTQVNTNSVKDLINNLLTPLNEIVDLVSNNKDITRSESAMNTLKYNIRGLASTKIDSITNEDSPKYLSDIGVTVDSNGKFSVTDSDTLEEFLKKDPQKVADLFTNSDGIVSKINYMITNLQGDKGLIIQRKSSITNQIKTYDDKLKETQSRIDFQADNLRKQYTSLLQTYYEAMGQYSSYSSFASSMSSSASGYSSLLR